MSCYEDECAYNVYGECDRPSYVPCPIYKSKKYNWKEDPDYIHEQLINEELRSQSTEMEYE